MSGCGECTKCCTLMAVEELQKKPCDTCIHVSGSKCSIYQFRPKSCREFECIWLQTQKTTSPWPKRMRPDRCGVMFTPTLDPNVMAAHGPEHLLIGSYLWNRVQQWLANGLTIINVHGDKRKLLQWKQRSLKEE
jgi:hypothetical protein